MLRKGDYEIRILKVIDEDDEGLPISKNFNIIIRKHRYEHVKMFDTEKVFLQEYFNDMLDKFLKEPENPGGNENGR